MLLAYNLSKMLKTMPLATRKNLPGAIELSGPRMLNLARTCVMGVLNVTPDSFSDGGEYDNAARAVSRALEMERQGADIIDIGGESSRPGADPVPADQELKRVIPVIEGVRKESQIPLSIDTYKASVAEAALDAGADIINDISALRFDSGMIDVVRERKVPVILMHMLGTPTTMQVEPHYDDCVREISSFFDERMEICDKHGIDSSRIILDPGIGFGKRVSDNIEILARLGEFTRHGLPLLVGTSRKSFIGRLHHGDTPAGKRLGGSIASMLAAIINGADIVRVHDVAESVEAIRIISAIREGV